MIRISGDEAVPVAAKMFSGPVASYETHTVRFGKILNGEGRCIDEGLVIVMRAPRSYTGEDTVEIHCHGGLLLSRQVLETACMLGARPALPGEFTCKAFRNGKIDLTQAEAVRQLIASKDLLSMEAAGNQLQGKLGKRIAGFQERLIEVVAGLEAVLDFPDEVSGSDPYDGPTRSLRSLLEEMEALSATFRDGRRLTVTSSVCLLGAPNAGKSSLMNALAGMERAIVTDVPGTTRDTVEEEVRLGSLTLRLIDTAGLRESEDLVEKKGIERSFRAAEGADVLLFVVDVTAPFPDEALFAGLPEERTVIVWNKIDLVREREVSLPDRFFTFRSVAVSAKAETGLHNLTKEIEGVLWSGGVPPKEEVLLTNERHAQSLRRAQEGVRRALAGLRERDFPELLISDIRFALRELGVIIGIDVTEDVLTSVFSTFCIGK